MSLQNNRFLGFGGEPSGGQVPTQITIHAQPGQSLSHYQLGGVKQAYQKFSMGAKLSIIPLHKDRQTLPDGTVVEMTSRYGLDTVNVWPPSGVETSYRPLPRGIVISLFKVTGHNEEDMIPWWDEEARIPVTLAEEDGASPAPRYPGSWKFGQYNVLVTIDGKKELTDTAFADGQIKFKLLPSNAISSNGTASALCSPDDEQGEVWEPGVTPWYADGVITMGGWTLPIPNVVPVITPSPATDIKLFIAVDIAPTGIPYDQRRVKGWVFFTTLTVADGMQTFKLFGRRVLGMLDPTLGASAHDDKLNCDLLAEQSIADDKDAAPFGYKVERSGKKPITIKSVGSMFESEVVSEFVITASDAGASATMVLREAYKPADPTIPASTYELRLKRVVSDLSSMTFENKPLVSVGAEVLETSTAGRLIAGEQDAWTGEWITPPSMQGITATRAKSELYSAPVMHVEVTETTTSGWSTTLGDPPPSSVTETFGEDLETNVRVTTNTVTGPADIDGIYYHWPVSASAVLTRTWYTTSAPYTELSAVISAGSADGCSYAVEDEYTLIAHTAPFVAPSGTYSDTDTRMLAADASVRRTFGLATLNTKSISLGGGYASIATSSVSLVVKHRDATKPDIVIYADLLAEFVTPLQYAAGGSTTTGKPTAPFIGSLTYGTLPSRTIPPTGGEGSFYTISGGNLTSLRLPLTEWVGLNKYRMSYYAGYCNRPEFHPVSGAAMLYGSGGPAPTSFDVVLENSYTPAEYAATFGVTTGEISAFGVTGTIALNDARTVQASAYTPMYSTKNLRAFTPQIVNLSPKMYADPRNGTFITQVAGFGLILGTGMSVIHAEPMLRLLVGNEFGAIPLEPQITAWIEKVNESRAAMVPARAPFPTYGVGELFIDYDEALPGNESPIY